MTSPQNKITASFTIPVLRTAINLGLATHEKPHGAGGKLSKGPDVRLSGPPVGAPSQIQLSAETDYPFRGRSEASGLPGPADKGALCRLDSCFGYTVDEPHWPESGGRS